MERISSEQTICGYPLYELIAFAQMCRREGIREGELKAFITNCQRAYDLIRRETQEAMFRSLQSQLDNYESTAQ